jgi:hypothetical protein
MRFVIKRDLDFGRTRIALVLGMFVDNVDLLAFGYTHCSDFLGVPVGKLSVEAY